MWLQRLQLFHQRIHPYRRPLPPPLAAGKGIKLRNPIALFLLIVFRWFDIAVPYRELLNLYPDARWISGNAEKAGKALKGDDTCGYDIKYTDGNGVIQYVEVKASRNDEITFILSDNVLRFACKNASCYEVIYVVIGDDGMPAHEPWRLGHLFELAEGEDLLHNDRFSIESDSYSVTAKPIAQKS